MTSNRSLFVALLIATPLIAPSLSANERQPESEQHAMLAPPQDGRIARSIFTTQVIDREPVNSVTELRAPEERVFYYTELLGLAGQTVTHRWSHDGQVMAEVSFRVGGQRWRVWSSKNLVPGWAGDWKVSVLDETGEVLGGNRFTYQP